MIEPVNCALCGEPAEDFATHQCKKPKSKPAPVVVTPVMESPTISDLAGQVIEAAVKYCDGDPADQERINAIKSAVDEFHAALRKQARVKL